MASDTAKRRLGGVWHQQLFSLEDGTKAGIIEKDAYNCGHCSRFVILPDAAAKAARPLCHRCNSYSCGLPDCVMECNPMEESIELSYQNIGSDIPFLTRGPSGEVLYDKEKLKPTKSYRAAPREII